MALKQLTRHKIFKIALSILFAILFFYVGYQLAIYQMANYKALLPHLNIGISQDLCSTDGQPYCSNLQSLQPAKPVIYLYPTRPEIVNVRIDYPPGFSRTIPAYDPVSGWTVQAQPNNGQLTDITSGQQYPYLVWEGNPVQLDVNMNSGFIIPGSATKPFLEHELAVIGLSTDEISSFVSYWLPKMQSNRYNLIHFDETDYTSAAKLSITPKPDSLLRVLMLYKPISQPTTLTPQSFPVFDRHGFAVVEWGGAELD